MEIVINQYWIKNNRNPLRVVKIITIVSFYSILYKVIENTIRAPLVFSSLPKQFKKDYTYLGTTLKNIDNVKEEYPEHFI